MKAALCRGVSRAVFVFGALAAAYLIGLSQRVLQVDIATAAKEHAAEAKATAEKLAEAAAEAAEAARPIAKLSRDEVWTQIQAFMQNQKGTIFDSDDALKKIKADDYPYLIQQLAGMPLSQKRDAMLHFLLVDGFSDIDPVAALLSVEQIDQRGVRDGPISHEILISMMNDKDAKAVLSELSGFPPGPKTDDIYAILLAIWINKPGEYADAAAFAATLPTGPARTSALMIAAETWTKNPDNCAAALNWASSLPPEDSAVMQAAMQSAINTNPTVAAQYLDNIPLSPARNDMIEQIGIAMSNVSSGESNATTVSDALDWLGQIATGDTYDQAVTNILNRMKPADEMSILDQITDPDLRETAINQIFGNVADGNADSRQEELNWAQTLPEADRATAMKDIVQHWANNDPQAALAFAKNSSDPSLLAAITADVAIGLAVNNSGNPFAKTSMDSKPDPTAALAYVQSLPAGSAKDEALNSALEATASYGNGTVAWNYVQSLPESDNTAALMGNIALSMPPDQAAVLLGQMPTGPVQTNTIDSVMQSWEREDPQAVATWVGGLPPGSERDTAAAQLAATQAAINPDAALALASSITDPQLQAAQVQAVQLAAQINTLPAGDDRDAAITRLVSTQIQQNPQEAMLWANSISDPQVRFAQIQRIVLGSQDPNATLGSVRATLTGSEERTLDDKMDKLSAAK